MSATDESLIARARQGDAWALGELLQRHHDTVYRFARRMCASAADADDVLQETMLAAMEHLADFRGEAALSSWLYSIARSRCTRVRRHHQRETDLQDAPDPVTTESAEDLTEREQLRVVMHAGLDAMEPKYREVLLLRDMEGLSAEETSKVLGLGLAAMKSRLFRARRMLEENVRIELEKTARRPLAASGDVLSVFERAMGEDIDRHTCERLGDALGEPTSEDGDPLGHRVRRLLQRCRECPTHRPAPKVERQLRAAITDWLERKGRGGAGRVPSP